MSNTAFRGFGGPQGMIGVERVIDEIACALGQRSARRAQAQFLRRSGRDVTPYGMTVEDNIIAAHRRRAARRRRDYRARRARDRAPSTPTAAILKRGIALTPVKFGISFTATHLNQAGALVHVYSDGSVHLNHGGTEMGQGLYIKVAQVVAEEFGIDARPGEDHRDHDRQGAEHLGDRGLVRLRPQRHGGAERGRARSRSG